METSQRAQVGWLDCLDKCIKWITLIGGGVSILFLMGLTVSDVVMRYLFNSPIFGAQDLLQLTLLLIVAFSTAFGGRSGAHIEIELFEQKMNPHFARWSLLLVRLVGAVLVGVLAWRLIETGIMSVMFGEATQLLLISYENFYYVLAAGMALYSLVLLAESLLLATRGVVTRLRS
ncbi:MAG: TRAP transporter small permease [Gammaproteobacteria bacterium]|nr:MAG: TRAP transporter small permease [Gammaproteobacteria bacterium]